MDYLREWKLRSNRKPLVVRGARQVGKTCLVRDFAAQYFDHFIEVNFDETPDKEALFSPTDIDTVLAYLSADSSVPVVSGATLLFLDEIQRVPKLLGKLRYFYEKRPDVHVIAAGSLLDFALAEHEFSMPVGRIEYLFMGPMDFPEFLLANDQKGLIELLHSYTVGDEFPLPFHGKLQEWTRAYMAVGGMPAAVWEYAVNHSLEQAQQELSSIMQTFRDDFAKYRKRVHAGRLRLVLERLPHLVGARLKYVNVSRDERARDVAEAIQMLEMAQLAYRVHHSSGNALPLRSEKKERDFKPLFLDVGLMLRTLHLTIADLVRDHTLIANRGSIAEQLIGQQLLYLGKPYEEPELYYWNRPQRSSSAEVDYLIPLGGEVLPVEVKAGTTGSLKSLHVFAAEKDAHLALRFNLDQPTVTDVQANTLAGRPTRFKLVSLPLYMASEAIRLCAGA